MGHLPAGYRLLAIALKQALVAVRPSHLQLDVATGPIDLELPSRDNPVGF